MAVVISVAAFLLIGGVYLGSVMECVALAKSPAYIETMYSEARPWVKADEASPEYLQWLKEHPRP